MTKNELRWNAKKNKKTKKRVKAELCDGSGPVPESAKATGARYRRICCGGSLLNKGAPEIVRAGSGSCYSQSKGQLIGRMRDWIAMIVKRKGGLSSADNWRLL